MKLVPYMISGFLMLAILTALMGPIGFLIALIIAGIIESNNNIE